MKRVICILLMLVLMTAGLTTASAARLPGTRLANGDVPAEHLALHKKELASAKANAKKRAPGQSLLMAEAKGSLVQGYTGSKSDNSLKVVKFTVTDSVVQVGETVTFYADLSAVYLPMVYTPGGVVFNESFSHTGDIYIDQNGDGVSDSFEVNTNTAAVAFDYKPTAAGYFNFVLTVSDGNGNRLAVTTPTVQVYSGDLPAFENVGSDMTVEEVEDKDTVTSQLAMSLNMSRESIKVGQEITATVALVTTVDPVSYIARWRHTDANGNTVSTDAYTVNGQVNAQGKETTLTFDYRPLKAGKLQFVIEATDGEGNHINNNSSILNIEDAYYLEARLNRISGIMAGDTVTATYSIQGHECDTANYYIGWEIFDADDNVLASKTSQVDERSGKSTFSPRYGHGVEFYVGASCGHITGTYPARASVLVINGLQVDLELTASTVKYGSSIGVAYSVEGGLEPYKEIVVTGYSYDKSKGKTYTFLTKSLTEAASAVSGTPKLGDEVYFVVKVVESDGNATSWKTGKASFTGAPEVTVPEVTVTGVPTQVGVGDAITLTYEMTGGSGTVNAEGSSVIWCALDGTVISTAPLSVISGKVSFTPTQTGGYTCQLVLTDDYGQQVTWKSETITAVATLPGDADGSGKVEPEDVLLLMQYSSGWPVTVNKLNADVDGNGSVNYNDAVLILRYLAGEGVTLT